MALLSALHCLCLTRTHTFWQNGGTNKKGRRVFLMKQSKPGTHTLVSPEKELRRTLWGGKIPYLSNRRIKITCSFFFFFGQGAHGVHGIVSLHACMWCGRVPIHQPRRDEKLFWHTHTDGYGEYGWMLRVSLCRSLARAMLRTQSFSVAHMYVWNVLRLNAWQLRCSTVDSGIRTIVFVYI